MSKKILVIEDNPDLGDLLSMHLRDLNFEVVCESDGKKGLRQAETGVFDLIILDIMLPGVDGIEILKQLRSKGRAVPILMLTSKSSETDRVVGLELGADDYVTKPFSIPELLARVKALLRRVEVMHHDSEKDQPKTIVAGELVIYPDKRTVLLSGNSIDITTKEFDLLYFFASHPGRAYSRTQLLDQIWGYSHSGYEHTVNSHINRLRAKIEENPAKPNYILTVWGVGYKFTDDFNP